MKKSISKTKITVLRVIPLCSFTSKVLTKIDPKAFAIKYSRRKS